MLRLGAYEKWSQVRSVSGYVWLWQIGDSKCYRIDEAAIEAG